MLEKETGIIIFNVFISVINSSDGRNTGDFDQKVKAQKERFG